MDGYEKEVSYFERRVAIHPSTALITHPSALHFITMGHEKVTVMILDVHLKCSCCYKKVKRVLCNFPQIRDQMFDEDKNKVLIKVVCCNPEKIRDMLCCKGGKIIQRIEIVEDKPGTPTKREEPQNCTADQDTEPDGPRGKCNKPKSKSPPVEPEPVETIEVDPPPKKSACCLECNEGRRGGPCEYGHRRPVPACCQECNEGRRGGPCEYRHRRPVPACCQECNEGRRGGPCENGYGRPVSTCCEECNEGRRGGPCEYGYGLAVSACCGDCYEGRRGGPCEYGYGRPVPPPPGPCYDGSGNQYGRNRSFYVSRCDYLSEENPQGCSIM